MGKYSDRYRLEETKKEISEKKSDIEKDLQQPKDIINDDLQEKGLTTFEAVASGIKNFPKSAYNQVKSIYEAVSKPVQTWEGVKAIAKDIYKDQMDIALKDMGFDTDAIVFKEGSMLENIKDTPTLDYVVDDLKKTWGTYDGFKEALATDPARILTDVVSIVAPSAKIVEGIGVSANLPKLASIAEKTAKVAALSEPATAASAITGKGVGYISKLTGKVFESMTPSGLYRSATKMSTTLTDSERARLAEIAIKHEIVPNIKGLDKIDGKIRLIDTKIASMIDEAEITGAKMQINDLFKHLNDLKESRMLSAEPMKSARIIDKLKKDIIDANKAIGREGLTPKEAQKLKQTIYKDLNGTYEKFNSSQVSKNAQKQIARAAKEYLEELLPEIKQLNKTDSDLIALRDALERPVSRISNRDLVGLGASAKTGAGAVTGGMIGGPEGAAILSSLGIISGVLGDPIVKSKLAIVLDKLQAKGLKIKEDRAIKRLMVEKALTQETDKDK